MLWDLLLRLLLTLSPLSTPSASLTPGPSPVADPHPAATAAGAAADSTASGFSADRAPLRVRFGDDAIGYDVMAEFVLPGQTVAVAVDSIFDPRAAGARFELTAAGGQTRLVASNRWRGTAPARAGMVPLELRDAATGDRLTLHVFVLVPYAAMRHGAIDGYRIGRYPRPRHGHEAAYERPRGFVEVTPALLDTWVSPHFQLGQFVCKQDGGFPKYLVLRPPLLIKLEELLAEVNRRGIVAHGFGIMSAYRTPTYNAAIGNVTVFSRHEYGDAADIFVDEDGDGVMDDLNHDGRHTIADAQVLQAIVDQAESEPAFAGLDGGLGTYPPTPEHGPFVHVDVRGFDVRWSG